MKDRDKNGQFLPGKTGNPKGKPKGTKSKRNQLIDTIMAEDDNAEAIIIQLVEQAKGGDTQAANILLARYAPPARSTYNNVNFQLDDDLSPLQRGSQILDAVANGDLAPDVGNMLITSLTALARTAELVELEQRIAAMEAEA